MRNHYTFIALLCIILIAGCVRLQPEPTEAPEITAPEPVVEEVVEEEKAEEAPPQVPEPEIAPVEEPVQEQIETPPEVSIITAPLSVPAGERVSVMWKVITSTSKSIPHTAVHYGPIAIPTVSPEIHPNDLAYTGFTPNYASGEFFVPDTFSASFTAPEEPGTLYFRTHAIVDGKNYYSDERSLEVTAAEIEPSTFRIEADDRGFYPNSISVNKGDEVEITFVVRTSNVYFGGLDFRSNLFRSPKVTPGNQWKTTFTADETFSIKSYWPASNKLKSTMTVNVE